MTDVTSATAAPPVTTTSTAATGTMTGDFETFLQMLTTQLKYQDPMDPMESSEFAVQLATLRASNSRSTATKYSQGMSAQMATSNMAEVAGWIGQEVRVASPVYFDGEPITISPNPAAVADRAELVVRDEDGNELSRQSIPVSADPIEWAGVTTDGAPLPEGVYSFEVVSYSGDEVLIAETAEVYAEVVEVRAQGGVNVLMLDGGIGVPASSVTAIRVSESAT